MPPLCTAKKGGRTEGASFAQSAKSTERKHAVLSASSAHRWLACPPSAMLEKELPDETTVYAEEGSVAHEVAEYKVRWYLGERDIPMPSTGNFNAEEIDRYTDSYAYYVTDKIETIRKSCPDAVVLVEQRLDFSNYVEDGFGTGDLVIVADDVIQVIDFKYGKGVAVSAEHNPQMMLYALGALNLYDYLYDIKWLRWRLFSRDLTVFPSGRCLLTSCYHGRKTHSNQSRSLQRKARVSSKPEVIVGSVSLEPPAERGQSLCLKLRNTNSRNLQN